MPSYKLTYFDIQGRGELIRWIFAVAKKPYTDERIKFEDWPKRKATTPFGQLPVLEVDGTQICQSYVIAEYLAKQFGLAGKNDLEQAQAAMIAQCAEDAYKPLFPIFRESDESKKKEVLDKYTSEQLPDFLSKFEALLAKNSGGNGYFVGSKLSWADLAIVSFFSEVDDRFKIDFHFDKYPKLNALKSKVESDAGLADWLKKRPKAS